MIDNKRKKLVLGIETSCDETGLAIVEKEKEKPPKILVNLIFSQNQIHSQTKGVVPEIAAREQVAKIFPMLQDLKKKIPFKNIDYIGVTAGPGLIGSLLVGINLAKTLSYSFKKPLIAVNHLSAHLYSAFLYNREMEFPAIGLIVSGGHTSLVLMKSHREIKLLGQTLDDAAGEAFDKVAALLNLGYPGGPAIEKAAQVADQKRELFFLPRPLIDQNNLNFSFSGLKTAVLRETKKKRLTQQEMSQLAWEFQEAVVEVLVEKLSQARLKTGVSRAILGGGVVANQRLREKIGREKEVIIPPLKLSTDNGAMVAARASYLAELGEKIDWRDIKVRPALPL